MKPFSVTTGSYSDCVKSALVKREEWHSEGLRIDVFWKAAGESCPPLASGGSSTSAHISSSATGGMLGERDAQASAFGASEGFLSMLILSVVERLEDRDKVGRPSDRGTGRSTL